MMKFLGEIARELSGAAARAVGIVIGGAVVGAVAGAVFVAVRFSGEHAWIGALGGAAVGVVLAGLGLFLAADA